MGYLRYKKDGSVMHFDIVAPDHIKDEGTIHAYGKDYLVLKEEAGQPLSAKECSFCHIENALPEMVSAITEKGYYIIEMQGCR